MSGSGPTVFGLFDDMIIAGKAEARIREEGIAKDLLLTRPFNLKQ